MNINLSKDEEKAYLQIISMLENRSRRWPCRRWVGIIVSIVVLFSSILLPMDSRRELPKLELPANVFNPEYVKLYIDCSISANSAKEHLETAQAIPFFGSLYFLVYFFVNRNRGARAGLLAKLLRQALGKDTVTERDKTSTDLKPEGDGLKPAS